MKSVEDGEECGQYNAFIDNPNDNPNIIFKPVQPSHPQQQVLERGVGLSTRSDSELITQILSLTPLRGEHNGEADWQARIRHLMEATPTSYSLALMNEDKIYGVRDPFGNRPLCVGLLKELDDDGIGLASEYKMSQSSILFINFVH